MRGPRMSKSQKVFLVNFLEENKDLVHYNSGSKPSIDKELKWRDLAKGLNSPNLGPSKTTAQWKDTFKDFRTSIRRKSKILQTKSNPDLKVSNTELRFMKLLKLYTPPSNSTPGKSPKKGENEEEVDFIKLENDNYDTNDNDNDDQNMSDDDPLIGHSSENNENSKNDPTLKKEHENLSQQEFIEWQRNKIEERLNFNGNASLAVEIENHALQVQKLASSFEKHAEAINAMAGSFDRVAAAIENVAEKLIASLQR